MATIIPGTFTTVVVMREGVSSFTRMSEEEFVDFCKLNPELRAERSRDGEVNIMPPTGGETGRRNLSIGVQLGNWCERDKSGIAFDSSTGFRLPNTAQRSPDAAWLRRDRWDLLTQAQREQFLPLAPDFVIELVSKNDRVDEVRAKMREYIECGVRLGWLIDPYARRVEVYRPEQTTVVLDNPETVSADPELPGFVLDLKAIW